MLGYGICGYQRCGRFQVISFLKLSYLADKIYASSLQHGFGSIENKIRWEIPHQFDALIVLQALLFPLFLPYVLIVEHDAAHFSRPPLKTKTWTC
jgi:hypothetical protein